LPYIQQLLLLARTVERRRLWLVLSVATGDLIAKRRGRPRHTTLDDV
jgi:hypothetical protein